MVGYTHGSAVAEIFAFGGLRAFAFNHPFNRPENEAHMSTLEVHHVLAPRRTAPPRFRSMRRSHGNTAFDRGSLPGLLANPVRQIPQPDHTIYVYADVPGFQANSGGGPVADNFHLAPIFWGDYWLGAVGPSLGDVVKGITEIVNSPLSFRDVAVRVPLSYARPAANRL